MTVTRSFAVAAAFAAVAVGAATPASAAPEMSGHYTVTETAAGDRSTTNQWYFTPCGDGCASAANTPGGRSSQVQLVGGKWKMDTTDPAQCPDGTQVPNALSAHYTWDPSTLAGTVQTTADTTECGDPAGYQATDKIQLRQAS